MKVLFSVGLLLGVMYAIWWGYKNLLRRESEPRELHIEGQFCQLCRKPYPVEEMVIREKMAGFENYFCGDCITSLMLDYQEKQAAKLTHQEID
jgi:hypothetical protein